MGRAQRTHGGTIMHLDGKSEGKRQKGGRGRRWEDNNIKNGSYENRMSDCGLDSSGSGQGSVVGSCEHGNESAASIKCRYLVDRLSDCQLLEEDCSEDFIRKTYKKNILRECMRIAYPLGNRRYASPTKGEKYHRHICK